MNTTMENFVGLSAVLTGFSQEIIAPTLDPVDIKSEYLKKFQDEILKESKDSHLVSQILEQFSTLKNAGKSDQEIGEAMLSDQNTQDFVMACRKLIFMWYSGAWPTISNDGLSTSSELLSSKSYVSGLAWQVMQAHPMGDSKYRYGYWETAPAPLSDYTGH